MVDIPPLAIVQARIGSTRLPGKMLLPLHGHPLVWWAWRRSVEAFGESNVVVAMPSSEENDVLAKVVGGFPKAQVFRWDGPEEDVLGRLYHAAHAYRWHPETRILRVTPDDPFKDPALMREVAAGYRHPVELSCEGVTLEYLAMLHATVTDPRQREHLSLILSPVPPPAPPPGVWTVDTQEDLDAIKATKATGYGDEP